MIEQRSKANWSGMAQRFTGAGDLSPPERRTLSRSMTIIVHKGQGKI